MFVIKPFKNLNNLLWLRFLQAWGNKKTFLYISASCRFGECVAVVIVKTWVNRWSILCREAKQAAWAEKRRENLIFSSN